jgi:hypothetical protein
VAAFGRSIIGCEAPDSDDWDSYPIIAGIKLAEPGSFIGAGAGRHIIRALDPPGEIMGFVAVATYLSFSPISHLERPS